MSSAESGLSRRVLPVGLTREWQVRVKAHLPPSFELGDALDPMTPGIPLALARGGPQDFPAVVVASPAVAAGQWLAELRQSAQTMQCAPPPVLVVDDEPDVAMEMRLLSAGVQDVLSLNTAHRLPLALQRALAQSTAAHALEQAVREREHAGRRLAELTEHLQSSIEHERAAIAREIHDDIGGALAAVKFDLAWISRHSTDAAMLAHASTAAEMVQHALGASQRIMMNLRPAILDQGLVAAIQWLASGFERRTGIKTLVYAARDGMNTSRDVAMTAYRTAQEAMTNISKYAQCTQVRIELADSEDVLTLEITDNGRGMDGSELEKPKAFGIKGLRERARTVGGWLDVSSQPGRGTSIILSVPLQGGAPAPGAGNRERGSA